MWQWRYQSIMVMAKNMSKIISIMAISSNEMAKIINMKMAYQYQSMAMAKTNNNIEINGGKEIMAT
jgi:hypothetical protein